MTSLRPFLATYRVQVHKDFTLASVRGIVPYLNRLGVSHLYSSPQLRARSGSTHGYDVVDPQALNPELGTDEDRRALVDALHASGMGMILDIVPNHMGIGKENRYWLDVLMHGPSSAHASWFDIDWGKGRAIARTRVLLPVLGKPLDDTIEADEIVIAFDNGSFRITQADNWFPLDPATVSDILNYDVGAIRSGLGDDDPDLREFDEIVDGLSSMPPRWSTEEGSRIERRRRSIETSRRLKALLERSVIFREHVTRASRAFTSESSGRRRLRTLLGMQAYELAFWQEAEKRINYRRFFDITDLAGIKAEDPQVFADTHRLILEWIADGSLDGIRVDHVDGLFDPSGYLERLQMVAVPPSRAGSFPVFVEKILSPGERLRETWPVRGTTGYEFLNDLAAAFISSDGSRSLDEIFRDQLRLGNRHMDFAMVAREGKLRILSGSLRADVQRVARLLKPLAAGIPDARLRGALIKSVVELVAALPVYRTYLDGRSERPHSDDAEILKRALDDVRTRGEVATAILDRLEQIFLEPHNAEDEGRLQFIGRLQQLSGPATAKGVEDTALYRYIPLASMNEVGSAPDRDLDDAVGDLHRANMLRAERWPENLLCTNTHDTKRSGDVRSRLHVLAEIPADWSRMLKRWRRTHAPLRTDIGRRAAPDAITEYLLYQTLAGVWPFPGSKRAPGADEIAPLRERVEAYMIKAAREAKSRTSWTNPDEEFESGLKSFMSAILESTRDFSAEMNALVSQIARPGLWNALSRALIHLTAPGTPDLYQGDELWNFALVDPDNRRPVNYDERSRLLSTLEECCGDSRIGAQEKAVAEMLLHPEDGRIKLYLTWRVLQARRAHPPAFRGTYSAIEATGSTAAHVIAFLREGAGQAALAIASRLPRTLTGNTDPPIGDYWRSGAIPVPSGRWRCVLSAREIESAGTALPLRELLGSLPVALFIKS
jgi:(1->4)-alpha-D-glucan 1-alpha-D-glucosylmutase